MVQSLSQKTFCSYFVFGSLLTLMSVAGCGEPDPGDGDGDNVTTSGNTTATTNTTSTTDTTATTNTTSTTDSTTGGSMTSQCGSGAAPFKIIASDATNMKTVSSLVINEVPVMPNTTALSFDWSGVTTDFYGHPFSASNVVQVSLVPWNATIEEVQEGINVDDPDLQLLAEIPIFLKKESVQSGATSATLTDFVDAGGATVPEDILLSYLDPAGGYTLTLILQEDLAVGKKARMIQAFKPTEGATLSTITLNDQSTKLEAMATFGSAVSVPVNDANITIDWGDDAQLTVRSFGGDFTNDPFEVIIGRYPLDADLEAGILDIEVLDTAFWRADGPGVGTSLNLNTLVDESGAAFPGITADAQYLLGVACVSTECLNPTPWFLTELVPCP